MTKLNDQIEYLSDKLVMACMQSEAQISKLLESMKIDKESISKIFERAYAILNIDYFAQNKLVEFASNHSSLFVKYPKWNQEDLTP